MLPFPYMVMYMKTLVHFPLDEPLRFFPHSSDNQLPSEKRTTDGWAGGQATSTCDPTTGAAAAVPQAKGPCRGLSTHRTFFFFAIVVEYRKTTYEYVANHFLVVFFFVWMVTSI